MNLTSDTGDSSSSTVQFVSFNQDSTSLAIGTKTGYKLFSLHPSGDRIEKTHEDETEDYCLVERLFSSSLVAVVSLNSPRKMRVLHYKKGSEICCYSYTNSILAIKMNRQRLIVVLESAIFVYNIRDMKQIHSILDTPRNSQGLCALSANNDNCYLAYPASETTGEVQIFDSLNLASKIMIPAHDNPIAALTFDLTGGKLATASNKGTIIRVWDLNGQKLKEFRRGYARCVAASDLRFSPEGQYLCFSSDSDTIHLMDMTESSGTSGNAGSAGSGEPTSPDAGYLPTWMGGAITSVSEWLGASSSLVPRPKLSFKIPFKNIKCYTAMSYDENGRLIIWVAGTNGILLHYHMESADQINLIKQTNLI